MQMIGTVKENEWKNQHAMYFYVKVIKALPFMYYIHYVSAINYMQFNLI